MPLLDSFCVDHTQMKAPSLRLAKMMKTPLGDDISVFDLRFCKPNQEMMDEKGLHTLEHLFAGFMREHLHKLEQNCEIIDISPMGCRTGFYMSVIGKPDNEKIIRAWELSMENVLSCDESDVPELNIFQCGSYKMHSLENAKKIAEKILKSSISETDNEKIKLGEKIENRS